jgi:hypothetical protein
MRGDSPPDKRPPAVRDPKPLRLNQNQSAGPLAFDPGFPAHPRWRFGALAARRAYEPYRHFEIFADSYPRSHPKSVSRVACSETCAAKGATFATVELCRGWRFPPTICEIHARLGLRTGRQVRRCRPIELGAAELPISGSILDRAAAGVHRSRLAKAGILPASIRTKITHSVSPDRRPRTLEHRLRRVIADSDESCAASRDHAHPARTDSLTSTPTV